MKIINRHTLDTQEIKYEEISEYVFTVSSEWVPFTVEDLHALLRSRDEIISEDREDIRRYRDALQDQKIRMQDGYKNGYESETIFWTRCIWEIDQTVGRAIKT